MNNGTFRGYNLETENIIIYDYETLTPVDSLHITEELRKIQGIKDPDFRNEEIEDVYETVKEAKNPE